MHTDLWKIWCQEVFNDIERVTTLVRFASQLAQANPLACQAVVEAGLLEMLLGLCLDRFSDPFQGSCYGNRPSLPAVWSTMLHAFTEDPFVSQIYTTHPVFVLWLEEHKRTPSPQERKEAWVSLELIPAAVELRLADIDKCSPYLSEVDERAALDIYLSLVQFAKSVILPQIVALLTCTSHSSVTLESRISGVAISYLIDDMKRTCEEFLHYITTSSPNTPNVTTVLLESEYEETVEILGCFFRSILASEYVFFSLTYVIFHIELKQ
jgi:hypothetical protein